MVSTNNELIHEIEGILSLDKYMAFSYEIIEETKKRLCDDVCPVEIEYCRKLLLASSLSIKEIADVMERDADNLRRYSITSIKEKRSLDQGQEYNPKEPPEEEDPSNETYVCHSKTFLLQHAIYYLVLKYKTVDLVAFLKAIRKPHAVKYAKALRRLFPEFNNKKKN